MLKEAHPHRQLFSQFWSYWPIFFQKFRNLLKMKKKTFLEKKNFQKFFCSHSVQFFWKSFDQISQPSQVLLSWKLAQMFLRGIARTCGSDFWKKNVLAFFGIFSIFPIFLKKWRHKIAKKNCKKKFFSKTAPTCPSYAPKEHLCQISV